MLVPGNFLLGLFSWLMWVRLWFVGCMLEGCASLFEGVKEDKRGGEQREWREAKRVSIEEVVTGEEEGFERGGVTVCAARLMGRGCVYDRVVEIRGWLCVWLAVCVCA